MRRFRTLAWVIAVAGCAGNAPPPIPLNPVRFLSINDVYVADTLADDRGGLARVATVRKRLADQGPIVFVLAGDVLSPSLTSKYYRGRQMIEAMNAANNKTMVKTWSRASTIFPETPTCSTVGM